MSKTPQQLTKAQRKKADREAKAKEAKRLAALEKFNQLEDAASTAYMEAHPEEFVEKKPEPIIVKKKKALPSFEEFIARHGHPQVKLTNDEDRARYVAERA